MSRISFTPGRTVRNEVKGAVAVFALSLAACVPLVSQEAEPASLVLGDGAREESLHCCPKLSDGCKLKLIRKDTLDYRKFGSKAISAPGLGLGDSKGLARRGNTALFLRGSCDGAAGRSDYLGWVKFFYLNKLLPESLLAGSVLPVDENKVFLAFTIFDSGGRLQTFVFDTDPRTRLASAPLALEFESYESWPHSADDPVVKFQHEAPRGTCSPGRFSMLLDQGVLIIEFDSPTRRSHSCKDLRVEIDLDQELWRFQPLDAPPQEWRDANAPPPEPEPLDLESTRLPKDPDGP